MVKYKVIDSGSFGTPFGIFHNTNYKLIFAII